MAPHLRADARARPCQLQSADCRGRRGKSRSAGPASGSSAGGPCPGGSSRPERRQTRDTRHETRDEYTSPLVSRASCHVIAFSSRDLLYVRRVETAEEPLHLFDVEEWVAGLDREEKQVTAG